MLFILSVFLLVVMSGIVSLAARLAVRRIMFGVGVMLFFLACGISVWHAWG